MKNPSKETLEKWRTDDTYWKCGGLFYYNKEDERLLPPKRVAWMGWTVNFANPKSVILMFGIIFLVLFLVALLPKKWII
jgi:uncharacterized membrane protein